LANWYGWQTWLVKIVVGELALGKISCYHFGAPNVYRVQGLDSTGFLSSGN